MPKILTCPICGAVVRTKSNAETCGLNYCRVTHYRRKKAKAKLSKTEMENGMVKHVNLSADTEQGK